MRSRVSSFVRACVAAITAGCASSPPESRVAAPVPQPVQMAAVESTGFGAERELNAAEQSLDALEADAAVLSLEAAAKMLADPKIETYPEARQLRARHRELAERVPKVRVEVRRRTITAAQKELGAALAELEKPAPVEATFVAAIAAIDALKAALDGGDELEAIDLDYAKYSLAIRKDTRVRREFVEKRRFDVALDASREQLGRVVAELKTACDRIQKRDVTGEDFTLSRSALEAAQKAVAGVGALAAKDAKFAAWVAQLKVRLESQKRAIDDRQLKVFVDAQKARVEEGRRAIADAQNALRGNDVADEKLALADGAVAEVAKILGEGAQLAQKDRGYASYANEVKKRLDEATARIATRKLEVTLYRQKRELDAARAGLAEAVKRLGARDPGDESFDEAKTALIVAEKMLDAAEAYAAKDRAFARYISEARRALRGTKKEIETRRFEVEVRRQTAKARTALADARKATSLESVAALEQVLDAGRATIEKDRDYAKLAGELRKYIAESREKLAIAAQRSAVETELENLRGALAKMDGAPSEQTFAAAGEAVHKAQSVLDAGAELERRLAKYASYATQALKRVVAARARIEALKPVVAFRDGPVAAHGAGLGALESAESAASHADKRTALSEALAKFQACEKDGAAILERAPRAGSKNLVRACAQRAKATEVKLESVQAVLDFYEGPAKSFANAKVLLGRAHAATDVVEKKKAFSEALASFETCLETGRILSHRHPELTKKEFDVEGEKLTIPGVVADCQKGAKSLRTNLIAMKN